MVVVQPYDKMEKKKEKKKSVGEKQDRNLIPMPSEHATNKV
jgi:hypothetical protein